MPTDALPDPQALKQAFDHDIYSSSGNPVKFGSLFYDCDVYPAEKRVLVIFIRHFFCGNCQEYVRRLSSTDSPFHPSQKSTSTTYTTNFSKPASRTLPTVVIIGPGQPSLISRYKSITQCPFDVYADPSTNLYDMLGMHRTLSMGQKSPEYIEHSLLSGAVKSAWQIVRRVGSGDALAGGDWNINGGEFLFVRTGRRSRRHSRSPSRSKSRSRSRSANKASSDIGWEATWCHRMLNSRDHTEMIDLAYNTCFTIQSSPPPDNKSSVDLSAQPLKSILVNGTKSHSRNLSHSYSSERLGVCPAPDIPKTRAEVLANPQHRSRSSPSLKSKSPHRTRSRSTSASSQTTARQNHDRIWSSMGTAEAARSDSRASTTAREGVLADPIPEVEEEEVQPRKSFSASVADRLGVRGVLLGRSKSVSGGSAGENSARRAPRPSTSMTDIRALNTEDASTPMPSTSKTLSLHRRKSKRSNTKNEESVEDCPSSDRASSQTGSPSKKQHVRNRTFSFSKSSTKHRPSLSLTRKSGGSTLELDDRGVMFVDGVEFVNVISVKARVEHPDDRKQQRERADSGLGMMTESELSARSAPWPLTTGQHHDGKAPRATVTTVPAPSASSVPVSRKNPKFSNVTALPQIPAVHKSFSVEALS